jgi:flavin reductase
MYAVARGLVRRDVACCVCRRRRAWWFEKIGERDVANNVSTIVLGRVAKTVMSLNPSEFRKAMGSFATGVTIITVDLDGEIHGMTANAFASVSLDPLLVLVCVDHNTRTHAHLHAKKRFGINVLREDQRGISEYYARPDRNHEHAETEAGAQFDRTGHGTPILHGALAYLECRLHTSQEAGDHTVFIAEVEDVVVRSGEPLLFFRGKYRGVGKEVGG